MFNIAKLIPQWLGWCCIVLLNTFWVYLFIYFFVVISFVTVFVIYISPYGHTALFHKHTCIKHFAQMFFPPPCYITNVNDKHTVHSCPLFCGWKKKNHHFPPQPYISDSCFPHNNNKLHSVCANNWLCKGKDEKKTHSSIAQMQPLLQRETFYMFVEGENTDLHLYTWACIISFEY